VDVDFAKGTWRRWTDGGKVLKGERNAGWCAIHGQFTSEKARTRFVDLDPVTQTSTDGNTRR
jgi:hypothetical protein